jgi:RNA polymerase sigma-70 factor (ECF subfamily)
MTVFGSSSFQSGWLAVHGSPTAGHDREGAGGAEPVARLVLRAKAGDSAAFSALYWRYVDGVFGHAFRRLGDRESAEDATQTTFLRALSSLANCRNDAQFGGWLHAIARNVVSDALSDRRVPLPIVEAWNAVDQEPQPEERVIAGEQDAELRRARGECLNDREQSLFDLLLTGLNDKEIAVALGMRHGALRTAHWRMLKRLRVCLDRLRGTGGADATR